MMMIQKIKMWTRNKILKKTEKKFGLYKQIPKLQINWLFTFIDRLGASGCYSTSLTFDNGKVYNRGYAIIDLYNAQREDTLLQCINHEALHIAIHCCLCNTQGGEVENVINKGMLKQELMRNGYFGNLYIKKTTQKRKVQGDSK